jgi:hypothetical protein
VYPREISCWTRDSPLMVQQRSGGETGGGGATHGDVSHHASTHRRRERRKAPMRQCTRHECGPRPSFLFFLFFSRSFFFSFFNFQLVSKYITNRVKVVDVYVQYTQSKHIRNVIIITIVMGQCSVTLRKPMYRTLRKLYSITPRTSLCIYL